MKTRFLIIPALIVAPCLLIFWLAWAQAGAGPLGEWKTQDGAAEVAIKPCGPDLCGYVSWSREGNTFVGREVFDMKPQGADWSGTVVNVANGRKYAARLSQQSTETLKIEGCVIDGAICGGQSWSRVK